ncbi:MAG: calcium/sodium antiporter [Flavobacteriales bacterium]|jgi:cation:H+ antiporter|nr:calcium/sodium antiporter [Flavobacteriales bacterium]
MLFGWTELVAGLILLVLGGDFLVQSSIRIATYLRVSPMVVGLTIVSFGTSFPELVVSVNAALSGHADISMGNVVGSNIANLALVLGITAIIKPMFLTRNNLILDWPLMLLVSAGLILVSYDGKIVFYEGVILLIGLIGYNLLTMKLGRKESMEEYESSSKPMLSNVLRSLLILIASLATLIFGANILIDGAVTIAEGVGVSERVIAVTIIAFGTSMPELATSLIAIRKNEIGLSLGNLIGSNVFNILAILGVTSTLTEVGVSQQILGFDMYWLIGIPLLVYPLLIWKQRVQRWIGLVLLASYISYIVLVF